MGVVVAVLAFPSQAVSKRRQLLFGLHHFTLATLGRGTCDRSTRHTHVYPATVVVDGGCH